MVQRYDKGDWCGGEYSECQMNPADDGDYVKYEAYEQLQAKLEKLKKFARYIIETECWAIFDLDGGDIQELAEKLGLIEPHIAKEEDVDEATDYTEVGDMIYRFTEALKGGK